MATYEPVRFVTGNADHSTKADAPKCTGPNGPADEGHRDVPFTGELLNGQKLLNGGFFGGHLALLELWCPVHLAQFLEKKALRLKNFFSS
jgi:hypothetical protein